MRDEEALLSAIIANPDEDTPRLVFADWLQENEQPERAEFIRVQIELAKGATFGEVNEELKAREHALLELQKWQPWDLAGVLASGNCQRHRGFVQAVHLHATAYLSVGEQLLALAPIRSVTLVEAKRRIPDISLLPRPRTARLYSEIGLQRRTRWRWRYETHWERAVVDFLNPDLDEWEDEVLRGRWIVLVWTRWNGDDKHAAEAALDHAERLARVGTRVGLRPLNLARGLGLICPEIPDPFTTPQWLLLQDGRFQDARTGAAFPQDWLASQSDASPDLLQNVMPEMFR